MTLAITEADRAARYLAAVPAPAQGQRNASLNRVAFTLVRTFQLTEGDFKRALSDWAARMSPPLPPAEVQSVLRSAWRAGKGAPMRIQTRTPRPQAAKPTIDPATLCERWLAGFRADEADLWDRSPIRPPSDWRDDGRAMVETLYAPDELINVVTRFELRDGKAVPSGVGETLARADWLAGAWPQSEAGGWLRMNPLDGLGVADKNVTAFRFALVEFDDLPLELQLSALARLPLPIAALLTSGRRSIHAWIRTDDPDLASYQATVSRLLGLLAKFGVDTQNKNPSRLSRLPGGLRTADLPEPGKQRVLYLNPAPTSTPIFP